MKQTIVFFMICLLLIALSGCEQANQAKEAVDKAISLKEDIEKKAKELTEKVQKVIPESANTLMGNEKKDKKEAGDEEGKGKDVEK
jgi:outer membrane lipoprotein-sorting protein